MALNTSAMVGRAVAIIWGVSRGRRCREAGQARAAPSGPLQQENCGVSSHARGAGARTGQGRWTATRATCCSSGYPGGLKVSGLPRLCPARAGAGRRGARCARARVLARVLAARGLARSRACGLTVVAGSEAAAPGCRGSCSGLHFEVGVYGRRRGGEGTALDVVENGRRGRQVARERRGIVVGAAAVACSSWHGEREGRRGASGAGWGGARADGPRAGHGRTRSARC